MNFEMSNARHCDTKTYVTHNVTKKSTLHLMGCNIRCYTFWAL